jgi:hypothetical protein
MATGRENTCSNKCFSATLVAASNLTRCGEFLDLADHSSVCLLLHTNLHLLTLICYSSHPRRQITCMQHQKARMRNWGFELISRKGETQESYLIPYFSKSWFCEDDYTCSSSRCGVTMGARIWGNNLGKKLTFVWYPRIGEDSEIFACCLQIEIEDELMRMMRLVMMVRVR